MSKGIDKEWFINRLRFRLRFFYRLIYWIRLIYRRIIWFELFSNDFSNWHRYDVDWSFFILFIK